jgi:hypothetical protein
MEPQPIEHRSREPFYVANTEEGWGVFRSADDKPVAGPTDDWGVIARMCQSRNRKAKALRPEDV